MLRSRWHILTVIFWGAYCAVAQVADAPEAQLASSATARHYVINVEAVTPEREDDYYVNLLRLILATSTAPGENVELRFSDRQFTQWRWLIELSQTDSRNKLLWTATSTHRETLLRPIRIPLFKGLIGIRLLVIRRDDEARFRQLTSLQDLQALVAGQGAKWPDSLVLKANGLQVTEGVGKEQLYKMLAAKRFDYFPRGVTEIANETAFLQQYDLMVAPKWYLSYPAAMYFFVNREDEELAARIETGFEKIIDTGEFEQFFSSHPRVKNGLPYLDGRQPFLLNNPSLPKSTPIDNPRYWYSFSSASSSAALAN